MKSKDGSSKYTKRNKRNNVHQNITRMDERAVLCFSVFSKFSPVSIYHLNSSDHFDLGHKAMVTDAGSIS